MKVLYDSIVFSDQTFGGISHYFVELMNNLPAPWDYRLSLWASENEYLKLLDKPCRHIPLRHFPEHRKLYRAINARADRRNISKGGYDVFHTTGFTPRLLPMSKAPVVATVHDMIYLDNYRNGHLKREVFENVEKTILAADHIIAISRNTRRELLEHFPQISGERVSVVYHGVSLPEGELLPLPGMPDNYVLFVGQRGGYKNFSTFLRAFSILADEDKTLQLVCTGRSFGKGEREEICRLGLAGRVVSKFIDAFDMPALYANARCFVFPSKAEGFGMPILEAFASGCPVALSNASCLPEIAGEGGVYFNPDDPEEMAMKISGIIFDEKFRLFMIDRGREKLSEYSWTKTAALTAEVYNKVIEQRR